MPEFDKIPRDRLEQWLKEIADSGRGSGAYAVKYTAQQLSLSQKEQARTNIGLEKSTDIEADHEDVSKYVVPNAIYSWVLEKLSALINPKGNWDSTVTYHKGDMVMVSAVLYLCITENASGVIGTSPVSDTTNWFFISKGPYDTNIVVDSETGAKTCNCVRNTEYRYTNASGITSLTLASLTNPNANEEYLFEVIFKSGTVATTFVNSANIYFTGEDSLLGIFTPVESKTYQLSAWWNGMSWQGVTRGVYIYSVENVLTQCTTSNIATQAISGSSYTATITPTVDYAINSYSVYMGGVDITATAYNNGIISISSVTGDVVITATAESQARLSSPVIDLTGSILSWTSVTNATGYSIRCDGEEVATSTGLSIDISTLFSEDGAYAMTVVATASGYRESNPSNSKTYLIGVAPIYGVSGLYGSDISLTRTDDAVGKTFAINSSSGAITSDFNDLFPWNETTIETISGNKFVKFPEMWFRVGKDASNRITDVAVSKQQGPTGNWYKVDPFYYSCYGGSLSNSKLASVSGATRLHTQTRATFRSYAAANGSEYFQEDLYHRTVLTFLWWIEWATKKSDTIMTGRINGSGTSGGSSMRPTGGTDSVATPSGYETAYAQMRYHYIEDFVGNLLEFVDGATGVSGNSTYYVTADPTLFSDATTGLNTLAYTFPSNASSSNRCVSAYGWDDNSPFLCQPKEQTGTDYTKYFCNANSSSNDVVLCCGARWDYRNANFGVSYFFRYTVSFSYGVIGGRLLYKPWCRGL